MTIQEWFDSVPERLQSSAHVKTVFGEPIVTEGKTIIPVAKVAYGFGGGLKAKNPERDSQPLSVDEGGGGGGMAALPLGVVEVTQRHTRFIPFGLAKKLIGALTIGVAFGMWIGRRREKK